jgi:hexosaminidase
MRRILFLALCILGLCAPALSSGAEVIPQPVSEKACEGAYYVSGGMPIVADPQFSQAVNALMSFLPPPDPLAGDVRGDGVQLKLVDDAKLGAEGYILDVSPQIISIKAASPAGAFYAVQTLRQLVSQNSEFLAVPCVSITDTPRFPWRGLMLDVARHFQPKEEVFKIIDVMALFKMNTLHLHLVDDQGWRLEIDAFPQLTKIGSKREASTKFDFCMAPAGAASDGYYTKDDMREIIAYAQERFITIVAEIEMPGHATAAIASIKGLSCLNQRFKVSNCWGVHQDIFCAGEEKVFAFLEAVLAEVAELFPGPYIHIGGDEAPKDRWRACPKCQKRIKDEGLKDEHELQSWFISRIETYVNSLGKQIIGWDEILEGGLPPRATVMSWRGMQGGADAAMQGHDVVMSPTSHCYFDYRQSKDWDNEPGAIGAAVIPLDKTYSFEPVPADLPLDAQKHILGTQGNLWTEHIATPEHLQYMAFPRAVALAEVAWSPKDARDWAGFSKRLPAALSLLKAMGVNCREPRQGELAD